MTETVEAQLKNKKKDIYAQEKKNLLKKIADVSFIIHLSLV